MSSNFDLFRLEADITRPPFDCNDPDLTDFFYNDSVDMAHALLSVTYAVLPKDGEDTIGFFSVSNDSIRKAELGGRSAKDRFRGPIDRRKRFKSLPAVKIGRLAVSVDHQGQGIGSGILDYLKVWFTQGNKTGCRFIVVDAYNKLEVIRFYERNGFYGLPVKDPDTETKLMFFDLHSFVRDSST